MAIVWWMLLVASETRPGPALPLLRTLHSFFLPPPLAGYLNDLHSFDTTNMTWTLLSAAADSVWPARSGHGFASAGGRLYVHGGCNWLSTCKQEVVLVLSWRARTHAST
jgi:hypothetical protein